MNTLTDNALMLKVKAGDLDKMGLLFARYNRPLYGYKREASEDMVQQVFYKMLKSRHTFTGDGEFVHWMYTIARNLIKDEGKKNNKLAGHSDVTELADRLPGGIDNGEQLERKEAKQELQQAMGKLNDDQREILTLSRFQELKHQEVAQIMGITEGAVKVRVHRAMQDLKNIYIKMQR